MAKQNPHSKKALKAVLLGVVVLAGIYYACHEGFIPGIGQGRKDADELKAKIEALQGEAIEPALVNFIKDNSILSKLPKPDLLPIDSKWQDSLQKDFDMNFSYEGLETGSEKGVGTVTIENPKINIISKDGKKDFDVKMQALKVSEQKGQYKYTAEGDIEIWADLQHNGVKGKIFVIRTAANSVEIIQGKDGQAAQHILANNVKLMEGRSGTTLLSLSEIDVATARQPGAYKAKASYKGLMPGDMIKLFIGKTDPVDINLDYSYTGQPGTNEGKLHVEDISVKMADSATYAKAELEFRKGNGHNLPYGAAHVRFDNYKKMLVLLIRYYSIPPEALTNLQKFIMESGADEGDDISFDLHFDGTKNPTINGKPKKEFMRIYNKNFPTDHLEVSHEQ